MADSSAIEKDADLVLLLDRQPPATEGSLVIAKGRDSELGVVPLEFRGWCARFVERGRPQPE